MKNEISRRQFIETSAKAGLMVGITAGAGGGRIFAFPEKFDVIIKNGLIVDGEKDKPYKTDLGIVGDRVEELGNLSSAGAKSVIDAEGKVVSPGFIDIHTHSDIALLINSKAESKIRQGVTTELGGNCGACPFPRGESLSPLEKMLKEAVDLDFNWTDLEGYQAEMEKKGIAVNYATLAGQGQIRRQVLGEARRKPSAQEMDVVFVAVKRNIVEKLVRLLDRAGVRPFIIEPASFSMLRAFNADGKIDKKLNMAVIDIDKAGANIIILRHGVPYIVRDIPLSSEDNVPSEEQFLDPVFGKLLNEIKLSFDFHEKQFPSETIDKVLIYSKLPLEGWPELVKKELELPVEVGDPLRGIKIKGGVVPPAAIIGFGLALRDIAKPFIDVNLYKKIFVAYRRKDLFLRVLFLEASSALFLLIILNIFCLRALVPLANELKRTLAERPKEEFAIGIDTIDELKRMEGEMEEKKHLMENIISSRTYFTEKLMDLVNLLPDNIWLSEVDFEEKLDAKDVSKVNRKLNIKGYCVIKEHMKGLDIVRNFLLDLKEKGSINRGMNKADIVSMEKTIIDGEDTASFEILFTNIINEELRIKN